MTWAIFSDEHIQAIGEIIGAGSGRVTAIVGGAMLDDTLRRTLSERLRNDKDIANKLLRVKTPARICFRISARRRRPHAEQLSRLQLVAIGAPRRVGGASRGAVKP